MTYRDIAVTLNYKGFPYNLEGEVLIPKYFFRSGEVVGESSP